MIDRLHPPQNGSMELNVYISSNLYNLVHQAILLVFVYQWTSVLYEYAQLAVFSILSSAKLKVPYIFEKKVKNFQNYHGNSFGIC